MQSVSHPSTNLPDECFVHGGDGELAVLDALDAEVRLRVSPKGTSSLVDLDAPLWMLPVSGQGYCGVELSGGNARSRGKGLT